MTNGFLITLGVLLAIALIAALGNALLHVAQNSGDSAKEID